MGDLPIDACRRALVVGFFGGGEGGVALTHTTSTATPTRRAVPPTSRLWCAELQGWAVLPARHQGRGRLLHRHFARAPGPAGPMMIPLQRFAASYSHSVIRRHAKRLPTEGTSQPRPLTNSALVLMSLTSSRPLAEKGEGPDGGQNTVRR